MRQVVFVWALVLLPVAALAQGTGWTVEVHGGGAFTSAPSGGTLMLPEPGPSLQTPSQQLRSRRVPSWFFGDGARLFNDVSALLPFGSGQITPLDRILGDAFAERQNGGAFGFRVSKRLSDRFSAEFNLDYVAAAWKVPSGTVSGIEDSAESFQDAWNAFFAPFPLPFFSSTESSTTIRDGDGSQIVATGALNINLMTEGRVIPYATVGGGIISNNGDTPTADLVGDYSLAVPPLTIFDEMDRVRLEHSVKDNVFVGVFGGGAKFFLTDRSGIRVDARVHLSDNPVQTLLSADPHVETTFDPELAAVIWTLTNPSVQLSNSPALLGVESSLSGAALDDTVVFESDGLETQVLVTVGYFWSF